MDIRIYNKYIRIIVRTALELSLDVFAMRVNQYLKFIIVLFLLLHYRLSPRFFFFCLYQLKTSVNFRPDTTPIQWRIYIPYVVFILWMK